MSEALAGLAAALVDRYVIERQLGAGGMATVYLAHDVRHNRKVALKVLRPELAAILGGERFLKELPHATGRVRVYDRASDDRVEQLRRMTRRIEFLDAAGALARQVSVSFTLRYIYKPEMELLLRVAGFARWEAKPAFASYTESEPGAGERALREGDNIAWTAWNE